MNGSPFGSRPPRASSAPPGGHSAATSRSASVDIGAFGEVGISLGLFMHFKLCFLSADRGRTGYVSQSHLIQWTQQVGPPASASLPHSSETLAQSKESNACVQCMSCALVMLKKRQKKRQKRSRTRVLNP